MCIVAIVQELHWSTLFQPSWQTLPSRDSMWHVLLENGSDMVEKHSLHIAVVAIHAGIERRTVLELA